MISAIKQSRRAWLPQCDVPVRFEEVVADAPAHAQRYLAMQHEKSVSAGKHYVKGKDVLILIGPEGDFTDKESTLAANAGFHFLTLGDSRLRTETAAIVALTTIHTLNQV
jgi:16S rRNA (uracil1498-N3)-methyltransferase